MAEMKSKFDSRSRPEGREAMQCDLLLFLRMSDEPQAEHRMNGLQKAD